MAGEDKIALCYQEREMYGVPYHHYFLLTNPSKYSIEFHGTDHFSTSFEIHNKAVLGSFYVETFADGKNSTGITNDMKQRLQQVEGVFAKKML